MPLYDERKAIVTGEKEAPADEAGPKAAGGEAAAAPAEPKPAEEEVPPGIPDFWLSALRANPILAEHVRQHPIPSLTGSEPHIGQYIAWPGRFPTPASQASGGTHACWRMRMQPATNASLVEPCVAAHAQITEKDEEVLAYLADVRCAELEEGGVDEEGDPLQGFKLSFHFAPNPFFDDAVLVRARGRTPGSALCCPCMTMPS